jgi:glycosyltransferase involved in cell wall biosynthesis
MIARGAVEVHLYGGQLEGLKSIVRSGQYDHILRLHGHVSREVALSAQAEAHLLLLLESPRSDARGVLTGKVFEYIASGVPILSLGSRRDSAIGRLLAQTGTGLCTEDNAEIIRGAILSRITGAPEWFAPNLDQVAKYSRERQAMILYETMCSLYQQRVETSA